MLASIIVPVLAKIRSVSKFSIIEVFVSFRQVDVEDAVRWILTHADY